MLDTTPCARVRTRLRRVATTMACAGLAFAAMPALAHARASITVGVHTQPAGAAAVFTFHVTGPTCPFRPPTDVTLQLRDGESAVVPLCRGVFTVRQDPLPGWTLTKIECVATPPDPEDPFVIEVPNHLADVELSPDEHKACDFTNTTAPTPPPGPGTPPPGSPPRPSGGTSPTAAQQSQPQQGVSPVQVVAARAVLSAPRRCVERRFTVTVRGGPVRSVAFSVNGRRVRTVHARRNQRQFTVVLPARTAVVHVTARVTFSSTASRRTKTLRTTVRRCTPAAVRPNFTG